MSTDIRWVQRLNNWNRALTQLDKFIQRGNLNELEEQGLIQCFEYNHELAWKAQKDFLELSGYTDLFGSRNVALKAFEVGLIENGEIWMQMIKSRNESVHTYNESVRDKIVAAIVDEYFSALTQLNQKMNNLAAKEGKS